MTYKLIISEYTDYQIDCIFHYISVRLNNKLAAKSVLSDIENAYDILTLNAESFSLCTDSYLREKEYHKLSLQHHDYVIIYRIDGNNVFISGIFHMLENYRNKL